MIFKWLECPVLVVCWFCLSQGTLASQNVDGSPLVDRESESVDGDAEIEGEFRNSTIRIRTTNRLAGAIDSIQWNGKEFIDSHDHGRQLQSACSFDAGQTTPFWAERYNPTEAGSSRDGTGESSTSKLLQISVEPKCLRTKVEAAFWLAPGETSGGYPALNETKRSRHIIAKEVRLGLETKTGRLPNVLDYRVTFIVPEGERHNYAQFEVLTGYMPPEFSEFMGYDAATNQLVPLSDGPGEQAMPIVFSTKNGEFAMGCLSAMPVEGKYQGPGYGRFRFLQEQVVKWNCVFRHSHSDGIEVGEYSFRVFVPIGTREDVRLAIQQLLAN